MPPSLGWPKGVVSNRFAREAEKFKIEIKANADTEIERVKAFLTRASRVHERQLDILAKLYRHLYEAQGLFQRMTSAGRAAAEITPEQYEPLLRKAMESAHDELVRGRLFIPQALAYQCVSFFNVVFKGQLNFSLFQQTLTGSERAEFWNTAATVAHQELPQILQQIDDAARTVIHGETNIIPT